MCLVVCENRHVFHAGDVVRKLRRDRRWTVQRLAQDAGLDKGTVSSIERTGVGRPESLDRLASALGVEVERIQRAAAAADTAAATEIAEGFGSGPERARTADGETPRVPLTPEQTAFLDNLAWACLRAAESSDRRTIGCLLDELVVAFRRAAHPDETRDVAVSEIHISRDNRGA